MEETANKNNRLYILIAIFILLLSTSLYMVYASGAGGQNAETAVVDDMQNVFCMSEGQQEQDNYGNITCEEAVEKARGVYPGVITNVDFAHLTTVGEPEVDKNGLHTPLTVINLEGEEEKQRNVWLVTIDTTLPVIYDKKVATIETAIDRQTLEMFTTSLTLTSGEVIEVVSAGE